MQYVTTEKKEYAEVLNAALGPMLDFEACEYALEPVTQQEYMKISDKLGGVAFFDVTGMTRGEILKDVCKVVLIDQARLVPDSMITDINMKRKIAGLFRR